MFVTMPVGMPAASVVSSVIERSLRFNAADSASATRTFGTPTDRNRWTVSFWMKLSRVTSSSRLFSAGTSNYLTFDSATTSFKTVINGVAKISTAALFRDPTAWMHIVWNWGGTSLGSTLYVNGVSAGTAAETDNASAINTAVVHWVGSDGSTHSHCYLANVQFIDGQALTAAQFGEIDVTTGVWGPKEYTLGYGINGCWLKFSNNTSTVTLGTDSGNANNWTMTGFSVAAGGDNDSVVDVPIGYGTDTGVGGEVRGNYCTLNPLWPGATSPNNGNLDSPPTVGSRGNMALLQFDAYWEVTQTGSAGLSAGTITYAGTANTVVMGVGKTYGFRLTTAGALDYINITDAGSWTSITTGLSGVVYVYMGAAGADVVGQLNAGQRVFAATAPSGFKALCTHNIPTPAIVRGDNYFMTNLRTGTAANFSVNGIPFQPDLVWIKRRSGAVGSNAIYDATRGVQKRIETNSTAVDATETSTGFVSFDSDGFSGGSATVINATGAPFVDCMWKKGTTPGFDIVSYTGNATNRTIAHGLGAVPRFFITKTRTVTTAAWGVYHADIGPTKALVLNTTAAAFTSGTSWNNTAPTSSVFSVGTSTGTNGSGAGLIAYLFAEVPGFSKFGSYTGTAATDGPFIWCGFRPRWIMFKVDAVANWHVYDSARDPVNPTGNILFPNLDSVETAGSPRVDFLSTGFKLRTTLAPNTADVYVFMAFAEFPFKYARAR